MKFKKKVITISNEGLKQAEKVAEAKITLLQKAIDEAKKHVTINDLKAFSQDFISYTTNKIIDKNKSLKSLNLSPDKVLSLLEIDLNKLYNIQVEFEENKNQLLFDKEGSPYTKVNKEQFIQYTKNEEENKRLEAFQYLIDSLKEIEKHTHVYKGEVARLTSNAVAYDLRLNKWRINPIYFR
tara:strand:+ start:285 stop:830 length:546 start_codon:yes stop_codon:yes gene_type:complete